MERNELRVFFITPGGTASRGGMGRMAQYLIEEFHRHHSEAKLRVFDSYGPGRTALMPFYFLKCVIAVGVLCVMRPPDVIHLNLAAHGSTARKLLLMWIARACHVPTLLHIHASKFIPFCESLGPRARKLLIISLSRTSSIVVIGEYWKRYLVDVLGVPAELVTVIYNAVPLPASAAAPRTGHLRCRIVALGLLGPRKGTPELLNALAAPAMRELAWEAVIAGNGEVNASRARAVALGLTDRVEVPGWVDAASVARLLATTDIFVLPSHNEGLPVAILEAMGAGLPVVTTPVGAIPELVIPEQTGVLVPPGDSSALAEALARLVKNPELRIELGRMARERISRHFRIEVTAERFVNIYRTLASVGRPAEWPSYCTPQPMPSHRTTETLRLVPPGIPLRFIVFTCRDPRTDFRLPLVDALRRDGHEVHYIWLKRQPLVSGPGIGERAESMGLPACFRYLRRVTSASARTNIYFTTTNLCFPILIFALRTACAPGMWCFDMHDDLLYSLHGAARLRARMSQALLLRAFDLIVHAAPTLQELFPNSHHLGNASSVGPLSRREIGFNKVLILASIDERMDFAFLEAVAERCAGVDFELFGQVSSTVQDAMHALRSTRPNVHYHGAYVTTDLVTILESHAVMLAPYRTGVRSTRYLDPLRYYHALNSGMEVITTAIPQAEAFADRMHIVRAPEEVARVLERLRKNSEERRNAGGDPPITWEARAAQLVEILRDSPTPKLRLPRSNAPI